MYIDTITEGKYSDFTPFPNIQNRTNGCNYGNRIFSRFLEIDPENPMPFLPSYSKREDGKKLFFTEYVLLVENSANMLADDKMVAYTMIDSVNEFIANTDFDYTMILYNDSVRVKHFGESLFKKMTPQRFAPKGGVALWDAIGDAINLMEKKENESPSDTFMCPLFLLFSESTDTSSQKYSYPEIQQLIERMGKKGWGFCWYNWTCDPADNLLKRKADSPNVKYKELIPANVSLPKQILVDGSGYGEYVGKKIYQKEKKAYEIQYKLLLGKLKSYGYSDLQIEMIDKEWKKLMQSRFPSFLFPLLPSPSSERDVNRWAKRLLHPDMIKKERWLK